MAEFTGLHQVAQVIVQVLVDAGEPFDENVVHYGPPLEQPSQAQEQVRVTLLWTTPQPTHRNDPYDRTATGQLKPPPLTLSAFVLITTYGGNDVDPATAYTLLGKVMTVFHDRPEERLPMASLGDVGLGPLTFTQVPTAADLMEKVFSPLQTKHRPWVLYEVGPIQLVPSRPLVASAPPVRPGKIGLDVTVVSRPEVRGVAPERQARGGQLRLDVGLHGRPLQEVRIAGIATPAVAIPGVSDAVLVEVPPTAPLGAAAITVRTGTSALPPIAWSAPGTIEVVGAGEPVIEALATDSLAAAAGLTLTGQGLAQASHVLVWPDDGVRSPSEIAEIPVAAASAGSVSVGGPALAAALTTARILGRRVRVAVRATTTAFTPHVTARFT